MYVSVLSILACADPRDARPEREDTEDTEDTGDTPTSPGAASYDLPDGVTGFTARVTWETISAASCAGLTDAVGVRDDTICETCDFAFTFTSTEVERTGDPACDPLEFVLWLASEQELLHRPPSWSGDEYAEESPGSWYSAGLFPGDGAYTVRWESFLGYDGREVRRLDGGVRLTAYTELDEVATPVSDWWAYCGTEIASETTTDFGTVEASGDVPNGDGDPGDVWAFPVAEGSLVEVSANHAGWAEADLRLWLAGTDGCLAVEAADSFACQSAPTDTCPSLVWQAAAAGEVRVGISALGSSDEAVDYTLAVHVDGAPVTPTVLADDVALSELDYSLSTETEMSVDVYWTY